MELDDLIKLALNEMPEQSKPREYLSLIYSEDIKYTSRAFKLVLDSGFYISENLTSVLNESHKKEFFINAATLFQNFLSKGMVIHNLARGVDYHNPKVDLKVNRHLDPFTLAILVRHQLETFCLFNNMFLSSEDQKVLELTHTLWIICGLENRQKFYKASMNEEQTKKVNSEKQRIKELWEDLESNSFYNGLSKTKKKDLKKQVDYNKHQYYFDGTQYKHLGIENLFKNACGENAHLNKMYAETSLKTHPSYVMTFQFRQMFENSQYKDSARFYIHVSKILTSYFISDFLKLFPEAKPLYGKLEELDRAIISANNSHMREAKWVYLNDNIEYSKKMEELILRYIEENYINEPKK